MKEEPTLHEKMPLPELALEPVEEIPVYSAPPKPLVEAIKVLDTDSYKQGFEEGFVASGASGAYLALFICGAVMLLLACTMMMRHATRLMKMVCPPDGKESDRKDAKKIFSVIAPLILCAGLAGCAGKQSAGVVNPAPVPPDTVNAPAPVDNADKGTGKFVPHDASYREDGSGQYLAVHIPADPASEPRRGEPGELTKLLEMKGAEGKEKTAVQLMRPSAIREAARLVTFQTAMSWRYGQLVTETERYSAIMDTAFNFAPLMLTQGEALIMPPLLARAGASMRIEDGATATAAKTTYELLEPARYVAVVPHWREFLMMDDFPEPEQPNPAVLPKNAEERAIWRAAVREAWTQGLAEADHLYADNVSRMARSYRGVMLYHLLTAQHLLSRVNTASADLGIRASDNGNKLNIGQKVYRITRPSAFTAMSAPSGKKGGK